MPEPATTADIYSKAVAAHRAGQLDEARLLYGEVLAREPRHGDALELLGLVHAAQGETTDAVRVLEQAADVNPRSVNALFNLGMALKITGRLADAEARFRRVVRLQPDLAHAHMMLGQMHLAQYRPAEAEASLREALRLDPKLADADLNMGQCLELMGRQREAVAAYGRAAALEPRSGEALTRQGHALLAMNRFERAAELLDRATKIEPGRQLAWTQLGVALRLLGRSREAVAALERSVALDPTAVDALIELITAKRGIADWHGLDDLQRRAIEAVSRPDPQSTSLGALYLVDDPAQHQKAARAFVRARWPAAAIDDGTAAGGLARPPIVRPRPQKRTDGRIRIGYVSPDLGDHPVAHAIAGVLAAHERGRFEVHAFSLFTRDGELVSARIRAGVDRVHKAEELGAREFAALVRETGIDVLVDIGGHAAGSAAYLLATRPAPVQVGFLGYPGTLGLSTVDYLIADRIVVPPGDERHYDERIVRLPCTLLPNDLAREAIGATPDRASQGLPDEGTVLAAFHGAHKIGPELFGAWMRVLAAVEGSVLWLPHLPAAADNLRREAQARGIAPSRLVFGPFAASRGDHLARHRLADLFLDAAPYNAHTTTADALYMGLPVVTLTGRAFPGRVATSLVSACGLAELATPTLAEYEATAVRLARDATARAALRTRLEAAPKASPVFDAAAFARALEQAYARMHQLSVEGKPPAAFDLA